MNPDEQWYDDVERYRAGQMSLAEKTAFEARLQQDPELLDHFRLHTHLENYLSDEKGLTLRRLLKEEDRLTRRGRLLRLNPRIWAAAASVLVLLSIGYYALRPLSSGGSLYDEYFEPYPMTLNSRAALDEPASFRKAVEWYNKGMFDSSSLAWTQYLETNADNSAARFYRGICRLALDSTAQARGDFKKSDANGQSLFSQQCHWYIILSYLKENDSAAACHALDDYRGQDYKRKEMDGIRRNICKPR